MSRVPDRIAAYSATEDDGRVMKTTVFLGHSDFTSGFEDGTAMFVTVK
jgi:hypothetical protein